MTLADKFEERLKTIPASNPGYISCMPETLANVLSASLLRRIALEAADVTKIAFAPTK
jgi:hypothetical protein